MQQDLLAHIERLESRIAFQEDTIEQLNGALVAQQQQLEKLRQQMDLLISKFREMSPSQIASQAEETPPPHY